MNSAPPVHICFCICFRTHYLFRLNNAHIIVYIPNTSAPDISKYQPFLLFLSCLKHFRSLFGNAKRFIFFSQTNVSRSMLRHFIPLVLLLLFSTFFFIFFFIEYINVFWCWNWDMDSSCAIIPFSPAEIPQNYPFKSRIAIIGRRHAGPQEAIQLNNFRNISIKKKKSKWSVVDSECKQGKRKRREDYGGFIGSHQACNNESQVDIRDSTNRKHR